VLVLLLLLGPVLTLLLVPAPVPLPGMQLRKHESFQARPAALLTVAPVLAAAGWLLLSGCAAGWGCRFSMLLLALALALESLLLLLAAAAFQGWGYLEAPGSWKGPEKSGPQGRMHSCGTSLVPQLCCQRPHG
jgi:hypothetical protein